MENPPLTEQDFARYEQNFVLLQEVVAQMNRDFQLAGFDVEFSGQQETAYEELTAQICPIIEHLLEKQPERFWNLLYRIDLNEAKVKETLFGPEPDSIRHLTDIILKRELQKVVLRYFFSGKQLP